MNKAKQDNFITNNSKETQKLAEDFVKRLNKGDVLALYGNLGSGKTTFVQGLARGVGVRKRIISPTFIIVRSYKLRIKNHELRIMNFYHIDLYRIESKKDLKGLGIEDIINNPQNIVAIEWAEKMKSFLPKKRWDVKFEDLGGSRRKITINQKL